MILKSSPVVTVALPVFNAEKYLAESIESILNQTFTNFELIVINDGSTDNSSDILRSYAAKDARIRLIERENAGLSNTLNEIIGLSRGKWIARMDSDDIAVSTRLENQLSWLESTSADICGGWMDCFGSGTLTVREQPENDEAIKYGLLFGCVLAHPTVMMRSDLIKTLCYSPNWDKAEDYELWTRAALAGARITNIPRVVLKYRQHPAQISSASNIQQKNLTQLVRRSYWKYSELVRNIGDDLVEELLKLYEPVLSQINMDKVDALIFKILSQASQESRLVILGFAEILYLKACQVDQSAPKRWKRICVIHNYPYTLGVRMMMFASSKFRMLENPRLLGWAKYIHSYLGK
ncbi:glycosyltransferase [Polynucleobacter sp. MG-27-Goln-C1]|uniref:glycosyltransferase family 2 protein n=1 Tax=Polynucleobacter sp. MG-27-Goln-C1 TaxID=1819726 RepID=UPI001C0CDC58|nr:glycosyltransferase [Polynucleobacter sp. MG-27-Goln-C1]MBU3612839.1 glycosyltransferase [Polynucleobacter sp. MG-27-Goln-C1]